MNKKYIAGLLKNRAKQNDIILCKDRNKMLLGGGVCHEY